jgi:hypothetical protein
VAVEQAPLEPAAAVAAVAAVAAPMLRLNRSEDKLMI